MFSLGPEIIDCNDTKKPQGGERQSRQDSIDESCYKSKFKIIQYSHWIFVLKENTLA